MTTIRVFFTAHNGRTPPSDVIGQARNPGLVEALLRDTRIADLSMLVITDRLRRATAERCSSEDVPDLSCLGFILQRFAVELWGVPAIWRAPYIDQHLDVILTKEVNEVFNRLVTVSDGEKCLGFHYSHLLRMREIIAQLVVHLIAVPLDSGSARLAGAYGSPDEITDEEILARLLALNLERAGG